MQRRRHLQLQVVEPSGETRETWLERLRRKLEELKRTRGRPETGLGRVH